MATFVLVHGAFHGAWCWRKLVPELAARGHGAVAIDLPGGGGDPTPVAGCTLDGNAARIAAAIAGVAEPVVLVGHSLGGISIAATTELVPERIALLVYLCAIMPRDGDSVASISASPAARRETGPPAYYKTADGLAFAAVPERAPVVFYTGCSAEDVADAVPRLRPQAYAVQRAPVRLTAKRYGTVPRVFVECLDDNALSLPFQRDMVAKAPCPVVSLPSGHSPFFSHPALLAETLVKLAGET